MRSVEERLATIEETLKSIHETLQRIETQVTRTNGRVGKLEIWRGLLTGGILVLAATVVPIFLDIVKK